MYKLFLLILLIPAVYSSDTKTVLTEANDLFDQANEMALKDPDSSKKLYKSAALKYKALIDSGLQNPQLYTNLGNAWFFSGDKGRALLNYYRAQRLSPSDSDINHNIEFLKTQTVDEPPGFKGNIILQYLLIWHKWPFGTRLALFILFNSVIWVGLGLMLYRKRKEVKWVVSVSIVLTVILGGSLLATSLHLDNNVDGIVTEREVTPRQGNGYIYEMALSGPLHSGSEFKLLETRKSWYYIELPGGTKCWIPARTATMIDK